MNAQGYAAVRTAVQFVMAFLVAHVTVFAALPDTTRSTVVEWAVTAVCVGLWTYAIRWLETRTGDQFWPSTARLAGRLLMLGLGKQPTYSTPDPMRSPAAVAYTSPAGMVTDVVAALPEAKPSAVPAPSSPGVTP